jgi:hypothetical protein
VFLEQDVIDAYTGYVAHERHLHQKLREHIATGAPLSAFRRIFLLDRSLRPTRPSIHDIDYVRPEFDQGFFYPKSPHDSKQDQIENEVVITRFLDRHSSMFSNDKGHKDRTEFQRHLLATTFSLRLLYDELLLPLRISNFEDNQQWVAVLEMIGLQLASAEVPSCALYQMRPSVETTRGTSRGKIDQLFQGAHPDKTGAIYPGDRGLHPAPVTVQIHRLSLFDGAVASGKLIARKVPLVAVWLAPELRKDLVIQQQGN